MPQGPHAPKTSMPLVVARKSEGPANATAIFSGLRQLQHFSVASSSARAPPHRSTTATPTRTPGRSRSRAARHARMLQITPALAAAAGTIGHATPTKRRNSSPGKILMPFTAAQLHGSCMGAQRYMPRRCVSGAYLPPARAPGILKVNSAVCAQDAHALCMST